MRRSVNIPVQLISCCSTLGDFIPMRFRYEDNEHQLLTIHIEEVLNTKENNYNGIHELIFTCRATIEKEVKLFELKYHVNSHKWILFQMLN